MIVPSPRPKKYPSVRQLASTVVRNLQNNTTYMLEIKVKVYTMSILE